MDDVNEDRTAGRGNGPASGDSILDEVLQKVVTLARQAVAGADSVSITLPVNGGYRTSHATDDDAVTIDQAQYDNDGGPCLLALRSGQQVQITVGAESGRWPRFDDTARRLGVKTVVSSPLGTGAAGARGALNVYGKQDGRFVDAELRTAEMIGALAGIVAENATALAAAYELADQLRQAVASREIIGEAKGIIMERESCTRDEAFDVLRRASQRENRKLRELAEELVERVEGRERPQARRA